MTDQLNEFIKEGLQRGHPQSALTQVLTKAGWEKDKIQSSLRKFADVDFPLPVPAPTRFSSPRLFFVNLFAFVVLYVAVFDVITILFTFLDYYLPDGLGRAQGLWYSHRPLAESIRTQLSSLVVCAPLAFFASLSLQKQSIAAKNRIPKIRLILIGLTLFIAACAMVGNVSCLVYYFLSGELSTRFLLKVLILSVLVVGGYLYFRPEIQREESAA